MMFKKQLGEIQALSKNTIEKTQGRIEVGGRDGKVKAKDRHSEEQTDGDH